MNRYNEPGTLKAWVLLKAEEPWELYKNADTWADFSDRATTAEFTYKKAGSICEKIY